MLGEVKLELHSDVAAAKEEMRHDLAVLASDMAMLRRDTAKAADVATLREEVGSVKALLLQLVDSSK